jgi:hypothetical protein
MTPNEVITEVRRLIQDTKAPFRYSDTVLLGFVNQTLKKMVILRPDLFTTVTNITTVPNVVQQTLPATAVRLVELFQVVGSTSLEEADWGVFTRAYPQWTTDSAGTPTKYIRHPRNPYIYFLYPRPAAGVQLLGEYVTTPPNYALNDPIAVLPNAYFPVIVDGVVFLAESIDNEHVSSGRAKLFQDSFIQTLGVSLQSRTLTDSNYGEVRPAAESTQ